VAPTASDGQNGGVAQGKQTSGSRTSCNQHFNCGNGTRTHQHTPTNTHTKHRPANVAYVEYLLHITHTQCMLHSALVADVFYLAMQPQVITSINLVNVEIKYELVNNRHLNINIV